MSDYMTFPDTVEEFMEQYKVVDTDHVYTNGVEFIPIFRMKQWFEHLPLAQPEIIRCKDCKHFHYDMPYIIQGVPVLGHEVCDAWGDGCKTDENGFCFLAERRTDDSISD